MRNRETIGEWKKVLNEPIDLKVLTNSLPTKGKLVYEYNPFRNYRLTKPKYVYLGNYYSLEELKEKFNLIPGYIENNNIHIINEDNYESDLYKCKIWTLNGIEVKENIPELYEPGQLVDFITDELNVSLEHPIDIIPQYSYDGSVNLILNNGLDKPRIINSRFSATGLNTYEIIDRKGNNDTNIYDLGEQFDIDTSLYKIVNNIPLVEFLGTTPGGAMKVGNYHFYFKLADSDGNETDFVAESGLVSIFIGLSSYASVHTGQKYENSTKLVEFKLHNLDSAYDYITVYYSKSTAEGLDNPVTEYFKINKKYLKNSKKLIITGFEEVLPITASDINLYYNIVDSAKTAAVCLNMLFLGNVKKLDIPYKELQDLSLRIFPTLKKEEYNPGIDENYNVEYSEQSYIDSKYIYEKTGYWPEELYRFGIVYILPNGELTPVFNVRGGIGITESPKFTTIPLKDSNGNRRYIVYNEDTHYITESNIDENGLLSDYNIAGTNKVQFENSKGVCSFAKVKEISNNIIYGVDFIIPEKVITELNKYVKGYFFVRQTRIPLILALGITIGIDKVGRVPTIPIKGGVLNNIKESLKKTYVKTNDIDGINYISEGFLKRYTFKFEAKPSKIFGDIAKWVGVAGAVAGLVVVSLCMPGAALAATAVGKLLGSISSGVASIIGGSSVVALGTATAASILGLKTATVMATTAKTVGMVAAGVVGSIGATSAGIAAGAVVGGIATGIDEARLAITRAVSNKGKLDGRNTTPPEGYEIVESDNSRLLSTYFEDRIIIKDSNSNDVQGIVCPDYTVNQPYYNLIFTGDEHLIKVDKRANNTNNESYFNNYDRHFYINSYKLSNIKELYYFKIKGVSDNIKCVGLDNLLFRSRAGEAEEAWKYECIGDDYKVYNKLNSSESENSLEKNQKINTDIVRGVYSPYLAINNTSNLLGSAQVVNIYIPGYNEDNISDYIDIRMNDNSTFFAITDRFNIKEFLSYSISGDISTLNKPIKREAFRGDCYVCLYTLRIFRNFNDPSAKYNDEIVDFKTWKNNYDPTNLEKYLKINLGDINAVPLGMWLTFTLRSSNNLNIRTLDSSNISEVAMVGHDKGYFPVSPMSTEGTYKHADSYVYNKGFTKSVSDRWNFETPDVPHIKNWFGTRIMYSDIHINDGFKNGFRVFQGSHYRDYTRSYGEIVKLISLESNLLCVFEHGIALIPINERTVAGQGAGGNVYINTSNVLPENPRIISDMFGSLWPESILKTPGKTGDSVQYVYGVDTVAKKIWRTDGNILECISDFKVQEFLNNNITLGERELTPKIGIRNVKTHYNAFKRDVMFTFYDNTYGFEEKVWNLCWNELLQKFITFYSWVPSYMENINNIPFSFDRNTSKWIAKLGTSHVKSSFADGITLSNVIVNNSLTDGKATSNTKIYVDYITKNGDYKTIIVDASNTKGFISGLHLNNRILPDLQFHYIIDYTLERDSYGNYKNFIIKPVEGTYNIGNTSYNVTNGELILPTDAKFSGNAIKLQALCFSEGVSPSVMLSELYYRNKAKNAYADSDSNKESPINGITEEWRTLPIFKDITGKRLTLPKKEQINANNIVTLLNIKANINILNSLNVNSKDEYYNIKAGYTSGTSLVNMALYESVVAITSEWNLLFLSTDFWKHGQSGLIDITDDVYPTYWYGKLHPFEFECIVVNDPSVHKIFDNLELVANKAKPESFHYEIIGETYDFAKDKPNMYFRLEALKALWQYNGEDISYNKNFLKTRLNLLIKSADFPHRYFTRLDTINEIEDAYISITFPKGTDYRHLSGAEIVYYPNRQEYRILNHAKAVDLNDLNLDDARSLISANCQYLEDRWKVTINPILVCYKNEYTINKKTAEKTTTWADSTQGNKLPPLTIYNSPIPDVILNKGEIEYPKLGEENALSGLYKNFVDLAIDETNWLNEVSIYKTSFGEALNRRELDVKDKFIKIRIRYSGEELAVIDFLNTVYRISYS